MTTADPRSPESKVRTSDLPETLAQAGAEFLLFEIEVMQFEACVVVAPEAPAPPPMEGEE